jgi:hypothetical protein
VAIPLWSKDAGFPCHGIMSSYESIPWLDNFFQDDNLPENFLEICKRYSDKFRIYPYTIKNTYSRSGYYVEMLNFDMKDVTSQCFNPLWRYDRSYLLRFSVADNYLYLLFVHKMDGSGNYLKVLENDKEYV